MKRNEKGQWTAFNREYMPLGYNITEHNHSLFDSMPIHTEYKGLTEKLLLELGGDEKSVRRDEQGKICQIWFYNDATNPTNQSSKNNPQWKNYWEKLERLSKLEAKRTV